MDKKVLNLPILIALVVGNMIGTGIYVLPASLAAYGTVALLSWVYTSIGAIFIALTLASLNKGYPSTGGPYVYCKQAFGKPMGFIIAYTYWLSNMASIAGIAVASVGYLGFLTSSLDSNSAAYNQYVALACEISIVWFFTLINIIGLHTAGLVQLWLTVIKVLPLIAVSLVGITHIRADNLSQFNISHLSTFGAISSAATLTFWAFIGLEAATVPAENTKGTSDIARATVFGTLATALIYIISSLVLMGMLAPAVLSQSQFPFAEAGTLLFGASAALVITLFAFISGLGALNGCTLVQGQIVFAAARDRLFPRIFAKLSKHEVPVAGQLLSCAAITIFLTASIQPTLLKQFNNVALLAGLLTLCTYLITTLSALKLISGRRKLVVASLASIYCLWMISNFDLIILAVGAALIGACVPVYYVVIRKYASPVSG